MVYGNSRFSPVKAQLIVINSRPENEFLPGKELHFHPKSHRNFVRKKNYISAQEKCAVSTTKSSENFYFGA